MRRPPTLVALTAAWLALLLLTLASLGLGAWRGDAGWMPLAVAAIIWIKGTLVARCFIETPLAHHRIRQLWRIFLALPPLALLFTAYAGPLAVRWTTL